MSAGSTRTHKIFFTRDDGTSFLGDAIECEGRIWLVPEWIPVDHAAGTLRPARMICVDGAVAGCMSAAPQAAVNSMPTEAGRRFVGGGGGHFWHGRWYGYGVGPCWSLTPDGYIWVCG
jgi:hypothetical protein